MPHKKVIVIAGPTASGKSDLAIALAQKYDGEIISADSRQVYRGMDIGTGKVLKDLPVKSKTQNTKTKQGTDTFFSEGIVHHLIDVADPKEDYNVAHFVHDAKEVIADIQKRDKLPIICGGTHFWIEALLAGNPLPAVKPDPVLRKKLDKLSTEELFALLEKKDSARAKTIDAKNKVRLIRALEIIETLGSVPPLCHTESPFSVIPSVAEGSPSLTEDSLPTDRQARRTRNDNTTIIALVPDKEILHKNIKTRLKKRIDQGMIEEVETLQKNGLSWKRLEGFGLEYRYVALFLQKKISREEMIEKIDIESRKYAKRQLTFLRRMERSGLHIHWISEPEEAAQIIT
jgi:tRNA dimethylallyltransferase